MERIQISPRPNWRQEVERLGFTFYNPDGSGIPDWNESAYYRLNHAEIVDLEEAAERVHALCLQGLKKVVREKLYPIIGIDPEVGRLITEVVERNDPGIHGRIDFIYDGINPPKMLEYNAEMPSHLFETSIVQRNWHQQVLPTTGQCNRLHDKLVERWRRIAMGRYNLQPLYVTTFTPMPDDELTANYIALCAQQGGWQSRFIATQDIGFDDKERRVFTNLAEEPIGWVFKHVPWDDIMRSSFGANIKESGSVWIEPLSSMVLSNKAFMALLWEMYPDHPNLLPTFRDANQLRSSGQRFVKKPALGRQGQNIQVLESYRVLDETGGDYSGDDFVYQSFCEAPSFAGHYPNFGVWMVNDEPVGLSVREDSSLIVRNGSPFVPHIWE